MAEGGGLLEQAARGLVPLPALPSGWATQPSAALQQALLRQVRLTR